LACTPSSGSAAADRAARLAAAPPAPSPGAALAVDDAALAALGEPLLVPAAMLVVSFVDASRPPLVDAPIAGEPVMRGEPLLVPSSALDDPLGDLARDPLVDASFVDASLGFTPRALGGPIASLGIVAALADAPPSRASPIDGLLPDFAALGIAVPCDAASALAEAAFAWLASPRVAGEVPDATDEPLLAPPSRPWASSAAPGGPPEAPREPCAPPNPPATFPPDGAAGRGAAVACGASPST
jgi:hypothetical protein